MPTNPTPQPSHRPASQLFAEPFLRKLERLAILSRRAMAGQLQGERRSPKRGQSVEFADFRPYTPGDDFRRIDWNAYARLDRFFIKLFVEEEDLTVHLLLDASRSMDWGKPNKLAYAVRIAGALGYVTLAGLDRVTVTVLGEAQGPNGDHAEGGQAPQRQLTFPPHRGKAQATALFSFLQPWLPGHQPSSPTRADQPRSSSLAAGLLAYAARTRAPGPLVLLSDLFDTTPQPPHHPTTQTSPLTTSLNALLAKGFEVTLLHILAPEEVDPARAPWLESGGDFRLLDCETGAGVDITADHDLLQRYRDGLHAWQETLRRACGARSVNYVPIETTIPIEELLFARLRQRGMLR